MNTNAIGRLPAAVRAGMLRKISEANRHPVDGEPATKGVSMESEARYYYRYAVSNESFTFEAFLSALSHELSKEFPDISLTVEWMRQCDRRSFVDAARRSLAKLQAYSQGVGEFRLSFWDTHWKLTDVFIGSLGLSFEEIGITRQELVSLSRQYLQKDSSEIVRQLKFSMEPLAIEPARTNFLLLDRRLKGIPMPFKAFCETQQSRTVLPGMYHAYRKAATGYPIRPEEVGWSFIEHYHCEALIFPDGRPSCGSGEDIEGEPTAPATAETEERIAFRVLQTQPANVDTAREAERRIHVGIAMAAAGGSYRRAECRILQRSGGGYRAAAPGFADSTRRSRDGQDAGKWTHGWFRHKHGRRHAVSHGCIGFRYDYLGRQIWQLCCRLGRRHRHLGVECGRYLDLPLIPDRNLSVTRQLFTLKRIYLEMLRQNWLLRSAGKSVPMLTLRSASGLVRNTLDIAGVSWQWARDSARVVIDERFAGGFRFSYGRTTAHPYSPAT